MSDQTCTEYVVTALIREGRFASCAYFQADGVTPAPQPLQCPGGRMRFVQKAAPPGSGPALTLMGAVVKTLNNQNTGLGPSNFVSATTGKAGVELRIDVPAPKGQPVTRGVVLIFGQFDTAGVLALFPSADPQVINPGNE